MEYLQKEVWYKYSCTFQNFNQDFISHFNIWNKSKTNSKSYVLIIPLGACFPITRLSSHAKKYQQSKYKKSGFISYYTPGLIIIHGNQKTFTKY